MYRDDLTRVRHMLDYGNRAVRIAQGRQRRALEADDMLVLALERCVEIIGEAASQTSLAFRADHPEVPWAAVVGMRNRLVHAYVDVNLDILWATVIGDLPKLIRDLEELLSKADKS